MATTKNTYYITLQPKVDKNTIKDMENKFNQAGKNISKNLANNIKSAIKGSALAMAGAFGVGAMAGNLLSKLINLPHTTKNIALELRTLAIQTKNISMISDTSTGQYGALYQGLQGAGFLGDMNDIREVMAETAKSKATGGKFAGSKLSTGELLAQVLQAWQETGKKYGFNSQEFQDAKKEVEQIIGGVDTARKFESLVKGDKSIKDIVKQGQNELGIKTGSSEIYEKNLKILQGLAGSTQEAKMQKFLFNKNLDMGAINQLKKLQDSDFNMALKALTSEDLLRTQVTTSNEMLKVEEKILESLQLLIGFIMGKLGEYKPKNYKKSFKKLGLPEELLEYKEVYKNEAIDLAEKGLNPKEVMKIINNQLMQNTTTDVDRQVIMNKLKNALKYGIEKGIEAIRPKHGGIDG